MDVLEESGHVPLMVFFACSVFIIIFICVLRTVVRFAYNPRTSPDPRYVPPDKYYFGKSDISIIELSSRRQNLSKSKEFITIDLTPESSVPILERTTTLTKPPTYSEATANSNPNLNKITSEQYL